jgi:hypothetical protein
VKREKRKRDYIPLPERLAAALVRLLPLDEQRSLRHAKGPASTVLKLFQFDHIVLHAPPFNGSDKWWNLDPMQVKPHREKSRRDTSIVAKVDRIIEKRRKHEEAMKRIVSQRSLPISRWPKRKIPSRPLRPKSTRDYFASR